MADASVGTLLETIRVDKAILSPDGVSPAFGLSFDDERAALVCRRFCAAAREVVVLADHGVVDGETAAYDPKLVTPEYMRSERLVVGRGVRWELQDMRDINGERAVFINDNVGPRVGVVYEGRSFARQQVPPCIRR